MATEINGAVQTNQHAKKSILEALAETLKQDPAADLTKLLEEQARAYALLRSKLGAGSAPKKSNQSCSAQASDAGDGSAVSLSDGETDEWSSVLLDDSAIRVDHAIDPRVLGLLCPDSRQQTLQSFPTEDGLSEGQFATGLNAALRQGELLWRLYETVVVGLGPTVVVKIGTSLDPDGVTNLGYINTHLPSVPAPTFLGAITCGRWSYAFMTRGRGVTLEAVWPDLSQGAKRDVQAQLTHIFHDLRRGPEGSLDLESDHSDHSGNETSVQVTSRAPHIGSFVSALCKDTRRVQRVSAVPVHDEGAFNDFLVEAPPRRSTPASIRMLRPAMRDNHDIVMTHADLHPRNIMVEWADASETGQTKRCKVTSILDWEMAGWYPSYWEFVKAICNAAPRGPLGDWPEYLPTDAIGTWPVECALDSLIGRWLG
ncbi:phosphotransferase family protein [Ophiostoma piceae UAMH 11346]|uniref:Phosphotransferase family protein n=1 Tax=Ophiostoma piceae (strain UAMH 11346) TaxID=1262450 RepID=S3C0Q3_OPHP1|nr:phosphotransferase family protein [Ophiostoma piceae UAMH 11346]